MNQISFETVTPFFTKKTGMEVRLRVDKHSLFVLLTPPAAAVVLFVWSPQL